MDARCSAIWPSSFSASRENVLVAVPARSNASHARWSPSTRSFQCFSSILLVSSLPLCTVCSLPLGGGSGRGLFFPANVQRLLHCRDRRSFGIHDLGAIRRLELL